jgi:drug/metabolite transporter (DMT)-like permease
MKNQTPLVLLSYAAVYVFWGMTYYFIRLAGETIPTLSIMAIRWSLAGALFLVIAGLTGRFGRPPSLKEVLSSIILGLLLILGGNGLVVAAEKKVDSYFAALIITSSPLVVSMFDLLIWRKRISFPGFLGILLGIAGVGLLLWKGGGHKFDLRPEVFYLVIACLSWGLASSLGHRMPVPRNLLVNSGIQMFSVGILMFVLMPVFPLSGGYFTGWSSASFLGLGLLTLVGTLGFLSFSYLLQVEPAVRVVSYSFVNPVIAIVLGLFLGREAAVPLLLPGLFLILTGLFLLMYFDRIREAIRESVRK